MLKTGTLKNERAIGYNIDQNMKKKNISLTQLAELTQISEMRIKAIITGSVAVEDNELTLLAKGLDVNVNDLLHIVPDKDLLSYNIHYMGKANNSRDMNKTMDKVDMFVRLLNTQSDN